MWGYRGWRVSFIFLPSTSNFLFAQSGTGFVTSTEHRSWLVTFGFLSRGCFSALSFEFPGNFAFLLPPDLPGRRAMETLPFLFPGTLGTWPSKDPPFIAWAFHQLWVLSLSFYLLHSFLCGLATATENSGLCLVDRWPWVCRVRVDS